MPHATDAAGGPVPMRCPRKGRLTSYLKRLVSSGVILVVYSFKLANRGEGCIMIDQKGGAVKLGVGCIPSFLSGQPIGVIPFLDSQTVKTHTHNHTKFGGASHGIHPRSYRRISNFVGRPPRVLLESLLLITDGLLRFTMIRCLHELIERTSRGN